MYIQSTFIHIKGIGAKTEQYLWKKNILTWDDYVNTIEKKNLFFSQNESLLNASYIAYKERNIDYFAEKLNDNELYRLAISFPNDILFLDIETTGLSHYYDCITVIGWSLNNKYKYYIQGISNPEDFINDIQNSKIIVTFNGKIFDIPFIKKLFPNLVFPKCHIDLRFFSKTCGLGGSQKHIEKNINFNRPKALQNTDGYTATILWDKYKWGNRSSLKKLISYNFYDIEGMKFILDFCINHIYKQKQCKRFECPAKFYDKNIKLDKKDLIDTIKNSNMHVDLKSKLKYKNLYDKIGRNIKIVGIDLTGDKKRASGFCFMSNNQIKTMRVSTDEEIIQLIINFQPHIVSIDSPLSLPYGRISVFDDDPGRDKFGILRKCERILKKRGINSYPTLLPSMQKLTKRGIDITNKLRNLGFPVIESYPGAAQDIMGLPRKQAGLKYLKKGLGVFGLKGKFLKTDISHDELDAITAAIVGLFFLSGDFEAIGDERENLMIIPDVNAEKKSTKTIVGLAGHISSGKTTAGNFLKQKGFKYIRYSQILEKLLKDEHQAVSRQSLQDIGNKLNKNQYMLSQMVYECIRDYDKVVIDGLRHPEDFTFFFEKYGFDFKLLFIKSQKRLRKARYSEQNNKNDSFEHTDKNDSEKNIKNLIKLSSKIIYNNDSKEIFKEAVLAAIKDSLCH